MMTVWQVRDGNSRYRSGGFTSKASRLQADARQDRASHYPLIQAGLMIDSNREMGNDDNGKSNQNELFRGP
jgi:hypothetical protein